LKGNSIMKGKVKKPETQQHPRKKGPRKPPKGEVMSQVEEAIEIYRFGNF